MVGHTSHVWIEDSGSEAEKIGWLNALETIYDDAITYIDAITHASSYYTFAEVASKYFSTANDGSGSGLIAETLDGYTAQEIIDSGTPSGCIGIWSSSEGTIPDGWYLCDGTNSTPNLQDRFVVCAGGNYSKGNMGGSDTITIVASNVTIGGHSLTSAEVPLHAHGTGTDYYAGTQIALGGAGSSMALIISNSGVSRQTYANGSGSSHTHTATFTGSSNQDKRPPFYALCYIMKG